MLSGCIVFLDGGPSSWLAIGDWLALVGGQDGYSTLSGFVVLKSSSLTSCSSGGIHWSCSSASASSDCTL